MSDNNKKQQVKNDDHVDIAINVDIEYDFKNDHWQSNQRRLLNLTWRSIEYPDLRDLIVVCFPDSSLMSGAMSVGMPRYCAKTSSSFDYTRTDFLNHQFMDFARKMEFDKGYYICADNELNLLKVGTLDEARSDCGEHGLITPDLCDENQPITDTLIALIRDADRLSNGMTRRNYMWTGTRRYNLTHYRSYDLERWVTTDSLSTKSTTN